MAESTDYSKATRNCDIVMKGGITSGIVYPAAVCRLAQEYKFRAIGGTSAGAIAAAATAAAEYGRQHGNAASFSTLAKLPEMLGKEKTKGAGSLLFNLFKPQPETAPLFKTLTAGLRGKRGVGKFLRAALWNYFGSAVLFALPVVALVGLGVFLLNRPSWSWLGAILWALPGLLLAIVAAIVGIVRAVKSDVVNKVPANCYGLTTGMEGNGSLTPWLYDLFQDLAGKPKNQPLTFGDLWGPNADSKIIDLQMMTTSLTHGRPYRLPLPENEENLFFFKRAELERFFPKDVVDWMDAHKRPEKVQHAKDEYLPLPISRDLPVIVGTRMSLSFPFLISAVPLHAIDYSRGPASTVGPEPCWFSDGGISSNFPVHFFDGPLPAWPTFAINLRYLDEKPDKDFIMAETNSDGIAEVFLRFQKKGLMGFFSAIFEAMQNWQDNMQVKMPGFRDRVVHVCLGPGEGGLNLEMPDTIVTDVARKGSGAANELAVRFAPGSPKPLNWDNHRWVRFRSSMAAFEEMMGRLAPRLEPTFDPQQGDKENYSKLLERPTDQLPSYKWDNTHQFQAARTAVDALRNLSVTWKSGPLSLRIGAPRPSPELRARPKL